MRVLIVAKFQGHTVVFRQALVERAEEFAKLAAGGHRHRSDHLPRPALGRRHRSRPGSSGRLA